MVEEVAEVIKQQVQEDQVEEDQPLVNRMELEEQVIVHQQVHLKEIQEELEILEVMEEVEGVVEQEQLDQMLQVLQEAQVEQVQQIQLQDHQFLMLEVEVDPKEIMDHQELQVQEDQVVVDRQDLDQALQLIVELQEQPIQVEVVEEPVYSMVLVLVVEPAAKA